MSEFKKYRRSAIAEMADWHPGFDVDGVSISKADLASGSPKLGDKIARNPKDHSDKWLVAAAYFADNFEPVDKPVADDAVPEPAAWMYQHKRHPERAACVVVRADTSQNGAELYWEIPLYTAYQLRAAIARERAKK